MRFIINGLVIKSTILILNNRRARCTQSEVNMATQLSQAKEGIITEEMRMVAEDENLSPEFIRDGVAAGIIVIPKNVNHHFRPRGIGKGLCTKVNANIGHSSDHQD